MGYIKRGGYTVSDRGFKAGFRVWGSRGLGGLGLGLRGSGV